MSSYRPEGIDDSFSHAPTPESEAPVLPKLGFVGTLRFVWRQLMSMRVALMLLMLLAVAAVPGSVLPQRPVDPAKVAAYLSDHPSTGVWLDRIGAFDVYSSVWFSAIYLLLFVSLVGCIVPRTRAHLSAVWARPPRTPRRFDRFPARAAATTPAGPRAVVDAAALALRGRWRWLPRFRVDVREEKPPVGDGEGTWTAAAERGYVRETGNLVFHLALLGLLVTVGAGQFLHYRGQAIVVQDRGFANAVVDYNTFESGTGFDPASLTPFTLTLDKFAARFDPESLAARYFRADVTVREPDGTERPESIKVNHPLDVDGAKIYLQGNGYAPDVTVHDAAGNVAFAGPVPFLPADQVYTSRGVVKVPDVSSGKQIGVVGFLLPTAVETGPNLWRSVNPQPNSPLLVLSVWTGDLGLDTGVPQNAYQLDEKGMKQEVNAKGVPVTLYVRPGQTTKLPDGLGTISFDALPRYVALDLRHDPTLAFVLLFALTALAGLATSLFTPRRRIWVRAVPDGAGRTTITAAALARGDDLGLQAELDRVMAALPDADRDADPDANPGEVEDAVTADFRDDDLQDDALTGPEAGR
ncbi:cytochrome c biogenesis protein ResB [Pengzhenrongella sp.]|jgi:cytochrome c biogenesis protein|uniref:cytochrome c biogenesis protein ResB n=1 Tax=Pengzhenrongella sp. TaxID=2888820 RepID=UPI002F930711